MAALQQKGPRGGWFTGSVREFGQNRLGFLEKCARTYGDIVPFRLGPRKAWLISHPEQIEEILVTKNRSFRKHFGLRYFQSLIGVGLLTSEGDEWLRQRRLIQPAFHAQRLKEYAQEMLALTKETLAGWKPGDSRDIHHDVSHLTMAIACRTLFDADPRDDAEEVSTVLKAALIETNRRFGQSIPMPEWMPTPANRRLKASVKRLNEVISRLIDKRRQAGATGKDLLSVLFRAVHEDDGTRMSEKQLRDEIMTLFLAGHGTTANALSWTWYLLATHPEVQAKFLAEVDSTFQGKEIPSEMPRMPYMEAVITESMRLYPPAYIIGREPTEPVEIGGQKFVPGETIFMSAWVVHRDGRFFDAPEEFRPERWQGGLMKQLPKYAYFPFGGGPRVCIGNTFALMEFPLILASMAQKFRFTIDPTHEVKPWPAVTLRPENGIRTVLVGREG